MAEALFVKNTILYNACLSHFGKQLREFFRACYAAFGNQFSVDNKAWKAVYPILFHVIHIVNDTYRYLSFYFQLSLL